MEVFALCVFVCLGLGLVVDGLVATSRWRWRHAVATATNCEWHTTQGRSRRTYQACTVEWTLAGERHVGYLDYDADADPYNEQVPVSVRGDSVERTSTLHRRAITEPLLGSGFATLMSLGFVLHWRRRTAAAPAPAPAGE